MSASKLRDDASAAAWVADERRAGRRVIFTSGCFDVLHVGHVRSLRAARALGDRLVIGLNSDDSVRGLKGEGRPYFPQDERAEVLSELECVDAIVVVPESTMDRVLDQLRPDVFAQGTDYTPETIPERDTVLVSPGIPFVVPMFLGLVTALTVGDVLFWLLGIAGVGLA